MFRSLKRRIDNANQMQRMRNENPEEFRRALEKHTREQLAADNTPPVQSGPAIRIARWFLYLLTALILLVIFLGVPQADNPIFPCSASACCCLSCIWRLDWSILLSYFSAKSVPECLHSNCSG